jgi:hypothetical protein
LNADLTPALIAAGGGSAMLAGIWLHERRRDEVMRGSRVRCSLRFPVALDAAAATVALSTLAGLSERMELVFEVALSADGVAHALLVPETVRASVVSGLAGAIPSLRVLEASAPEQAPSRVAVRLFVPTPCVLDTHHPEAPLRTLAGLPMRPDEQVVVRLAVRPDRPRLLPASDSSAREVRDAERAWREKTRVPVGFQVAGLTLIRAASAARASELAGHLASVWRSRRGPVGGLRLTSERTGRSMAALPATKHSSGWLSPEELLPLLMLPLGETAVPGVTVGGRELPVPREMPSRGRRLFVGRDAFGVERPVILDATAARHHAVIVGPSGVGKSALLATSALSDIAHGYAGAAIDPKADFTTSVLERVPTRHQGRIVVLDPGDDSRPTPAIDVLHSGDPDACADVLIRTFKAMFPDWGIRSETWGRLGLRTLCEIPDATLADLGRLYSEESFRRAAVARLDDPFLISAWQSYEALSPAAKVDVVQAPLARVMALLSRPKVRAVLASPDPKLDIARLFDERKFLLVSLAPGVLGEAAPLIGAAVMFAIWSAIEARVTVEPAKRHPIFLSVDELATLTGGLPMGFELVAERARGLGAGLTVALQTLSRIPEPTRSALVGNAATFISFRAPAEEASAIARQLPGLSPEDVMALGRFEVAARVGTGLGSAFSTITGRTEPLPPATGLGAAIRDASAARYGTQLQPDARPAEPDQDRDLPVGTERRNT